MEDLNGELRGVRGRTKSHLDLKRYVPEYKIEKLKQEYVMKTKIFLENILKEIEFKQSILNEKDLQDRRNYADRQIKKIEERLKGYDEERICKSKDLISKIEYLKSYKINPLAEIKVSEEHTAQIFKFLSQMNLEDKYIYLHEFLKKKIKFDYTPPTDREMESLRRLKRFILQRKL